MKMTLVKPLCFFFLLLIACEREKSSKIDSSEINKPATVTTPPKVAESKSDTVTIPLSNADRELSQKREPKQKYLELVKLPEQPNPTVERFNREIKGINGNDPAFAKKLTQLWSESIAQLPATPLSSAEDAEVTKGLLLPREILLYLKATATRDDDGSAEAMLCVVAAWSAMVRDQLLTEFAIKRSNILPPSSIDIAMFSAINRSLEELGPIQKKSPFEPWVYFVDSANPIYRLLALRAATYTTSQAAWNLSSESEEFNRVDASAKLGFYLSYIEEKDPIILTELMRPLGHIPLPEARQAIEKILAQQVQLGNRNLIEAAEEALETQKIISP